MEDLVVNRSWSEPEPERARAALAPELRGEPARADAVLANLAALAIFVAGLSSMLTLQVLPGKGASTLPPVSVEVPAAAQAVPAPVAGQALPALQPAVEAAVGEPVGELELAASRISPEDDGLVPLDQFGSLDNGDGLAALEPASPAPAVEASGSTGGTEAPVDLASVRPLPQSRAAKAVAQVWRPAQRLKPVPWLSGGEAVEMASNVDARVAVVSSAQPGINLPSIEIPQVGGTQDSPARNCRCCNRRGAATASFQLNNRRPGAAAGELGQ